MTPLRASILRILRAGLVAYALGAPVFLASCGGSEAAAPEEPRPAVVQVTPSEVTLTFLGQTRTLTVLVLDQSGSRFNGTVTWASDDPSVATVSDQGVVTAVGSGTTTVRASVGGVSGAATVIVRQEVALLQVVSGDAQEAIAGETLSTPIVVRATDQGGTPVVGDTITFTPSSGTVDPPSDATDANGEASTVWTLGSEIGPQTLQVEASNGVTLQISAKSLSPVPTPDLVTGGTLVFSRTDPTSLEPVGVQVSVRNDGNGSTGVAFRVALRVDGAEAASETVGPLDPDASATVNFTVGPFGAGAHTFTLEVDADGAVSETDETNNQVSRSITVLEQKLVQVGAPITDLSAPVDAELLFRLDIQPGAASNLTIEVTGPNTNDVDLFVEGGERPASREQYDDCQSTTPTSDERCQIAPINDSTYHILLHAFTAFSGVSMTLTLGGEVLPFNIELVFVDNGTQAQDDAVRQAAQRWESFITLDVPDVDFSTNPFPGSQCAQGQPLVTDTVDDVRIYVRIEDIDGPGGTLAQAGPCTTRGLTHIPILGSMRFDSADVAQLEQAGALVSVVMHEMGHVLGFGTIWAAKGLLKNPSLPNNPGADTHFPGPLAIQAFDDAGGTNYTGGAKVPVENVLGEGSGDSHWRESVLGVELMTPQFNSGVTNPMSAISVQSMGDLGYTVDASGADPYQGSFSSPDRAARSALARGPVIDLSNDVRRGPIWVVDAKGRVLEVIHR